MCKVLNYDSDLPKNEIALNYSHQQYVNGSSAEFFLRPNERDAENDEIAAAFCKAGFRNNILAVNDPHDTYAHVISNKNTVAFIDRSTARGFKNPCDLIFFQHPSLPKLPRGFFYRKNTTNGLPFRLDPSNFAQWQVTYKRLLNSYLNPTRCLEGAPRNSLKFNQMISIFYELIAGCAIALLTVGVEFAVDCWKNVVLWLFY